MSGIQQKLMSAGVGGVTGCGGVDNAIDWINGNFDSVSPLSLAWASNPNGWQYFWSGYFDASTDTTPDSADSSTYSGLITGGSEYTNFSTYDVADGAGVATRIAFLLPDSTVQIVGTWCSDAECANTYQQTCVMTGVAIAGGYIFDIPIPDSSLCNTSYPVGPQYSVWPNSTYDGLFTDYVWSSFVTYCTANPTICGTLTTPGACMIGDPFFGDPPP